MAELSREPKDQYTFAATNNTAEVRKLIENQDIAETFVSVGGRLLRRRNMGDLLFGDLHDDTGAIQVVADLKSTADFEQFSKTSIGDWLGVSGRTGATRTGEPSIFVSDWVMLARTEVPFPSKGRGLTDPEVRSRQRYLDLAVNPQSVERFKARSQIVSVIRRELEAQGFMEVETPVLQPVHGGAAARPFETYHNALDMELTLRIAPELYLKRLVVGGLQRVFEIGRVFRNEGISTEHNPEFTIMEAYAANWDFEDQMKLTEELFAKLAKEIHGSITISYQGKEVDLTTPWPRRTMDSLVSEAVGEEVSIESGLAKLRELCDKHGVEYEEASGPGKLLHQLYEDLAEPKLWGPIFVHEYPKETAPLARTHRSRPDYTERFEGIVAGLEVCNAYTELNDAREQYERFKEQEVAGEHDEEAMPMDHDYVRALMYGLPPTAGLGIGIDRLAMLLTNTPSIRDVILFPILKPDGFKVPYQ